MRCFLIWLLLGFSIAGAHAAAPSIVSVSPGTGLYATPTFSITVRDPDGTSDITGVQFLISSSLDSSVTCLVWHAPGSSTMTLLDDAGRGWSASVSFNTTDSASNSQCTVFGAGSSGHTAGTEYTLQVKIAFKSAFAGVRNLYAQAWDTGSVRQNAWQMRGTYIVPDTVDLDSRPIKGPRYAAGRAAVINASNTIDGAEGAPNSCIHVDGSTGPCLLVQRIDRLRQTLEVNYNFVLSGVPYTEPLVYRNGILLSADEDYTFSGQTVTLLEISGVGEGDVLQAVYQVLQ